MSTADLHPVLRHHLVNSLGWRDLRPLQRDAVAPLLSGEDALLLAPTASGKTEAAVFPLLTAMAQQGWTGPSVLYLCPLKALLNNLLPRLTDYTGWLGRRVALWHGDVTAPARRAIQRDRPDLLLTTPESLEAMLVSVNVDHRGFLGGVRAVVVDEVHAFAGDDRGWHLRAVLERLSRVAGRPLQRVGLSATVGNPAELLTWLQGAQAGRRAGRVVAPDLAAPAADATPARAASPPGAVTPGGAASPPRAVASGPAAAPPGDVTVDYVGSLDNAATVIAALHSGEKRLVFCESRQAVEELGQRLRGRQVTTFLSHASLSADERRRAEEAFAVDRDCAIVATSTLELGIDVGDLDRVIQVDAPGSVSSFLQRIGRTGRRPGSTRNCLFLATGDDALTRTAALLLRWGAGWVEPVTPPPQPRHIVAQQILALCLQRGQVGENLWRDEWNGLAPFGPGAEPIVDHLVDHGFLDRDGGMLFIGPEAERQFGMRHFMGMTAVFVGAPEFTVLHGRAELGRVDPSLLTEEVRGERRLLLGGRSWAVTHIDWRRRRCFVEAADAGGRARWTQVGWGAISNPLATAVREVLLGADPPVRLGARAARRLAAIRDEWASRVHPGGLVVHRDRDGDLLWWTFAGLRANATLASTLSEVADPMHRYGDYWLRLRENVTPAEWRQATADAADRLCLPAVNERALKGLKFATALPPRLATATLAARLADLDGAAATLASPARFVHG